MIPVRTLILLLLSCLFVLPSTGQIHEPMGEHHPLYKLESRLRAGDASALFEIAPYFNSRKKVTEFLGYHILESVESDIAKRVVLENTLFTNEEFIIKDSTTATQFTTFLRLNKDKLFFSDLAKSFLITPLQNWPVRFELRALSDARKEELTTDSALLLKPEWVKRNKIDSLFKQRDPASLLLIASELFIQRNRFNHYSFDGDEFIKLLNHLTGTEIGLENESKQISWQSHNVFNSVSRLNLLIYFSKYYKHYQWDEKKSIFINPEHIGRPTGKEERLFQLLSSKDDSTAIDAFKQLSVCQPAKVIQCIEENQGSDQDLNHAIPSFTHKFLRQLVLLTDYFRTHHIDFSGTEELEKDINQLKSSLSFPERRKLEDKLINSLSLENITTLEYQAILYERSWELTYSAGRILDIFYSRNWDKLISNPYHLSCYLKKSALYNELGIIGTCNNYLKKFLGTNEAVFALLKTLNTEDKDIKLQIDRILQAKHTELNKEKPIKYWEGNKDYKVRNLKKQLSRLTSNVKDSSATEGAISKILSRINYRQIATALKAIENYPFKGKSQKFSFLERDWGFFMAGDFEKIKNREEFLSLFSSYSEYGLYKHYLDQSGITYTDSSGLDYDRIYDLLKYDVVVAFVGGGGEFQDNEVYSLIKLLELSFKTTLGFPRKLCNSNNLFACDSNDRANAWMRFMVDRKLLKREHNEPVSFHDETR